MKKRILAVLCIAIMVICQFVFLLPQKVSAVTTPAPGTSLVVRVGYMGDYKDYQKKAILSAGQLKSLPQQTNRYTNLSNWGTVKILIGRGPTITSILQAAGIDLNSVRYIDLRTKDGQGTDGRFEEDLTNPTYQASSYLQGTRYYYPNLEDNWENAGKTGTPQKGALAGKKTVSTILAIKSSDDDGKKPENGAKGLTEGMMTTKNSYRFCVGQTPLTEGVKTSWPRDVTSSKTAKWVYGIDVTLRGSPVDNFKVVVNAKNQIVGSKLQAKVTLPGNELFSHKLNAKNITWESSNPEVASISDTGMISFKKKGTVKISAKDNESGIKKEIVIQVTDKKEKETKSAALTKKNKNQPPDSKAALKTPGKADIDKKQKADKKSDKQLKKVAAGVQVTQIALGNEIGTVENTKEMGEAAKPLPKQEISQGALFVAAFTSVIFFLGGIIVRIDRYYREV